MSNILDLNPYLDKKYYAYLEQYSKQFVEDYVKYGKEYAAIRLTHAGLPQEDLKAMRPMIRQLLIDKGYTFPSEENT